MQAYALKEIIEGLGHEVQFVDYVPAPLVQDYPYITKRIKNYSRILKKKMMNSAFGSSLIKKYKPVLHSKVERNFINCYSLLGVNSKEHYHSKVDVLVVGSDEVFNCLQQNPRVGYAMDFFGKRNRAKKIISYASSFGSTTMNGIKKYNVADELRKRLCKFGCISVRDENSASIINELTGITPLFHLDPVLVGDLENKKWKQPSIKNYLVVYGYKNRFSIDEGKEIIDFAGRNNLTIVVLAEPQAFSSNYIPCRPDEILGYIKNASYVVTDTFHGTIFSIIYKKRVAIYCRKTSESNSTNAEKLLDLIRRLNMETQLMEGKTLEEVLLSDFDYADVDKIREYEKERTLEYLKDNLSL